MVQERILESLGGREITPSDSSYAGWPALLSTSDRAKPEFFEQVRDLHPDGYIVGIGAGGIFSLLKCFPVGVLPQGLVMVDINPHVVVAGRIMEQALIEAADVDVFIRNFFRVPQSMYQNQVEQIVSVDPKLKDGLTRWSLRTWMGVPSSPSEEWDKEQDEFSKLLSRFFIKDYSDHLSVPLIVTEHFLELQQLAREKRMAVVYANFIDPVFVDAVVRLPNFLSLTNIIYLTNMLDLTFGDGRLGDAGLELVIKPLRRYEESVSPPIFIFAPSSNLQRFAAVRSVNEVLSYSGFRYP